MKYEALICLPFWAAREAGAAEQPYRANTPGATSSICRVTACGVTGSPTSAPRWRAAAHRRYRATTAGATKRAIPKKKSIEG